MIEFITYILTFFSLEGSSTYKDLEIIKTEIAKASEQRELILKKLHELEIKTEETQNKSFSYWQMAGLGIVIIGLLGTAYLVYTNSSLELTNSSNQQTADIVQIVVEKLLGSDKSLVTNTAAQEELIKALGNLENRLVNLIEKLNSQIARSQYPKFSADDILKCFKK